LKFLFFSSASHAAFPISSAGQPVKQSGHSPWYSIHLLVEETVKIEHLLHLLTGHEVLCCDQIGSPSTNTKVNASQRTLLEERFLKNASRVMYNIVEDLEKL
jgi:hypothetical protein